MRGSLAWFARRMEEKLCANDHKGRWTDCTVGYLTRRIHEELSELMVILHGAEFLDLSQEDAGRVVAEAADVANFAMMIADNARAAALLPPLRQYTSTGTRRQWVSMYVREPESMRTRVMEDGWTGDADDVISMLDALIEAQHIREDNPDFHEANRLHIILARLVTACEDFASSEPGMPSHHATECEFDAALDVARLAVSP